MPRALTLTAYVVKLLLRVELSGVPVESTHPDVLEYEPVTLRIDRPFILEIREPTYGMPLFQALVTDPRG